MCVFTSIKAQNTFTATTVEAVKVKADTSTVSIARADTLSAGTVKVSDTLCTANALCVHQNARISGDMQVLGNARLSSGSALVFEANQSAIIGKQIHLPLGSVQLLSAIPVSVLTPTDPIDIVDPCSTPTAITTSTVSTGFTAMVPGKGSVSLFSASWNGSGFLEVSGGNALAINYFCGKDILLGTGTGTTETLDGNGRAGSKIYTGDYVEMRKKLQIGGPQYGIVNDPNNVALEVHTNSGTGIRVKTYTINNPEISVMNTNTVAGVTYNNRNTFVVYGDGKTKIRSWNIVEPMISVGKFTGSNDAGTEYFKVYADGRTFIGSKTIKPTNAHSDAILQVAGKIGCMELVVLDPITKWADYVFDEKYSLPSIKEVEKYVKTHKHLPEVPTEKEILENGLNVYEMNAVLLKKVEEQMLYIIQLNKKIEELEKEVKNIKHESGK